MPSPLPRKISPENYTFFIDIPAFSIYDSTQYIRNAGCTVLLYFDRQRLANVPSAFAGSFAGSCRTITQKTTKTQKADRAENSVRSAPQIFLLYRRKDASGPCAEIWQFCRNIKMKRGMINVGKAHSLVESFHDIRGWRYSPRWNQSVHQQ